MYFLSKNMCFLWIMFIFDVKPKTSGPTDCFFCFLMPRNALPETAWSRPAPSPILRGWKWRRPSNPRHFSHPPKKTQLQKTELFHSIRFLLYCFRFTLYDLSFINYQFVLSNRKSPDINRNHVQNNHNIKQSSHSDIQYSFFAWQTSISYQIFSSFLS